MKRIARILSGSGPLRRPHCSYREQGHTGALQVVHRSALIDRLLMSAFDPKRTLPDGARQSSKRQHILLLVQSSVAERTPVVPGLRRRMSPMRPFPRVSAKRARDSQFGQLPLGRNPTVSANFVNIRPFTQRCAVFFRQSGPGSSTHCRRAPASAGRRRALRDPTGGTAWRAGRPMRRVLPRRWNSR